VTPTTVLTRGGSAASYNVTVSGDDHHRPDDAPNGLLRTATTYGSRSGHRSPIRGNPFHDPLATLTFVHHATDDHASGNLHRTDPLPMRPG
jgi:hypothetical protein